MFNSLLKHVSLLCLASLPPSLSIHSISPSLPDYSLSILSVFFFPSSHNLFISLLRFSFSFFSFYNLSLFFSLSYLFLNLSISLFSSFPFLSNSCLPSFTLFLPSPHISIYLSPSLPSFFHYFLSPLLFLSFLLSPHLLLPLSLLHFHYISLLFNYYMSLSLCFFISVFLVFLSLS